MKEMPVIPVFYSTRIPARRPEERWPYKPVNAVVCFDRADIARQQSGLATLPMKQPVAMSSEMRVADVYGHGLVPKAIPRVDE